MREAPRKMAFTPAFFGTGRSIRSIVANWLWMRYHARRQIKARQAYDAIANGEQAFLAAIADLDEFRLMDLLDHIDYRIRQGDSAQMDRLRQSREIVLSILR